MEVYPESSQSLEVYILLHVVIKNNIDDRHFEQAFHRPKVGQSRADRAIVEVSTNNVIEA
jgi:hypothetical protein